jgi:hypothetical protein
MHPQLLLFGGRKDGATADGGTPCNDVLLLNTDGMKWGAAPTRGNASVPVRYGQATCCIREKVRRRLQWLNARAASVPANPAR